ncbi:hypothetical protein [Pseudoalteromonas sp. SW0106-04]|uniref:hypothetical protein n=1 Tax=Pseudoalteromonas sp. SW0106-04 TaxID=1702169 RepID=UPI0006B3FEFC|nr:hypothetical protein [Pseudoalteromonas sp. SW0106-04]
MVFQTIFSSFDRIIIAVLLFAMLGQFYLHGLTEEELESEQYRIQQMKKNFEQKQLEVTYLEASLHEASSSNNRLIDEREKLSNIQHRQKQRIKSIEAELAEARAELGDMRQSNDKAINEWANNCVPAPVVSMYDHAELGACNKNGHENQIRLRENSEAVAKSMHDGETRDYR